MLGCDSTRRAGGVVQIGRESDNQYTARVIDAKVADEAGAHEQQTRQRLHCTGDLDTLSSNTIIPGAELHYNTLSHPSTTRSLRRTSARTPTRIRPVARADLLEPRPPCAPLGPSLAARQVERVPRDQVRRRLAPRGAAGLGLGLLDWLGIAGLVCWWRRVVIGRHCRKCGIGIRRCGARWRHVGRGCR